MTRRIAVIALLIFVPLAAGCRGRAVTQTAPIEVVPPPAEGTVTGPVTKITLRFGPKFATDAMATFNVDPNFTFHSSDFCPRPRANRTSVIGALLPVNGIARCHPNSIYFYPNAIPGMPHWHMLAASYACGPSCVLPLGPQTSGKGFIFKPPYLVLSPVRKAVPSESVPFGMLTAARAAGSRPSIYVEQVAVQRPAPASGISVTVSNTSRDMQVCVGDVACGGTAASVTIAGGSKTALFYLTPFANARRVGKLHFYIAAVARGCEMGTDGGTIDYER